MMAEDPSKEPSDGDGLVEEGGQTGDEGASVEGGAESPVQIPVFQLNDDEAEFEELEFEEDVKLYELLDPSFTLAFVDEEHFRLWIWNGQDTTTRMKFIAAKKAPSVRDKFGPALRITSVDGGEEPLAFKILVGLEKPVELAEEGTTGPAYTGTKLDDELLKDLSLEKIALLLEKVGCEEGYEREMVIVNRSIYGYRSQKRKYMGSIIEEKKVYPLQEEVPDGTYLAEGLVPRLLFSFNNIVMIELLRKVGEGETLHEKLLDAGEVGQKGGQEHVQVQAHEKINES
ncbi:MAG: hypothetical protein ACTSU5_14795 [Promethearchaeota archaeon]